MKLKHILFTFSFVIFMVSCNQEPTNTKLTGPVFGTMYSVIYDSEVNYQPQFDSLFAVINTSMSTYIPDSDISKLNRNETVSVDDHFLNVFNTSNTIYQATNGAFDPTIGAVVNAWDFGPEGKIVALDSLKIDSLMLGVGFNKVSIKNNTITKPTSTFIDFNAIAKGYGVDVIGLFLESKNVKNYLVEIGGEIRTRGTNIEKQSSWKVGVEMPHFDGEQSILNAISLKNESMATSGTYRKFKIDDQGNRYSHIIDTKTGYPSKTNLLSISVIAENCMIADAYATAFKAMGIEKVEEFLETHPELKVFLIFENDLNEFETVSINGFPDN
ncbi:MULTISPECIES: FAD:protein FMN transferase [Bizionia]|uniref:FAD:protein FMN transferase n=1 Tax=Bizionia algoritergicola TaxID=291187 RepID=A0A5D0QVS4_9FLAO|nr:MULTISPECIES: FAD:protein FMN transferase [Bizionia]OBX21418.1 thiamine biosynthesis protein [Bizionia sp. APA-3]TYB72959.1 FAD:protein FMN transferase [Bizionia algoritergicola]